MPGRWRRARHQTCFILALPMPAASSAEDRGLSMTATFGRGWRDVGVSSSIKHYRRDVAENGTHYWRREPCEALTFSSATRQTAILLKWGRQRWLFRSPAAWRRPHVAPASLAARHAALCWKILRKAAARGHGSRVGRRRGLRRRITIARLAMR